LTAQKPIHDRSRFRFSTPLAQRAEAELNLRETQAFLRRWVPAQPEPEVVSETASGPSFRRVSRILAGQER
jgi:hypothetical protein